MIAAARRGLGSSGTKLLAVTALTSLGPAELDAIGLARDAVPRLGKLAIDAGADGLVCSPQEVAALRTLLGPGPVLVVPGIRPAGSAANDQRRTGTPAEAVRAGATYLVVGRPLRDAPDPAAAADSIAAELA
jgi:orotidine-5'-phosphate decarboxylase